jgi:hypothetical protein
MVKEIRRASKSKFVRKTQVMMIRGGIERRRWRWEEGGMLKSQGDETETQKGGHLCWDVKKIATYNDMMNGVPLLRP